MNGMGTLFNLLASVAALLGGAVSAALCDHCIQSRERGTALFAPILCGKCGRAREFWDSIPLLSWILNGGKCRFCGADASPREPILSFLSIALWLVSAQLWLPYGAATALLVMVSVSGLLCAAGICWSVSEESPILLPLLLCLGVVSVLLPNALTVFEHLYGALGMLTFGLLLRFLPRFVRGLEPLRADTLCYLCCAGLIAGWKSCFVILPVAVILAFLFSMLGRRKEKSLNREPNQEAKGCMNKRGRATPSLYLTGGAVVAVVFGRSLMNGYLALFSQIR